MLSISATNEFSIIYGQDNRSPVSAETTHVLYVAYAPPGVPADAVEAQLSEIEANIWLFASDAVIVQHRLVST
jgi:hypothetical protein